MVADSVLLNQLNRWNKYPTDQVIAGIKVYLDKNCAGEGKDENYLWGIIRKQPDSPNPKSENSHFQEMLTGAI